MLRGKKIVLGISASIAAYKSAHLVRLLIKSGAEVKVVMTPASIDFVTPLTLSTLSKNPVHSSFTQIGDENAVWTNHVELGLWADLLLIAPATSNTLAKMVTGTCDNLLLATYMSAKCPVYVAPAMDLDMYQNPATQDNLAKLANMGHTILEAEHGELASGLIGQGRMAEPEHIVAAIELSLKKAQPLFGKTVLVNAGPTYEMIDAVRFIGNFSTGKMGVAIAQKARVLGADVTLVLGPTNAPFNLEGMNVVRVTSADEMHNACLAAFKNATYAILTAAVADFKPKTTSTEKIKKGAATMHLDLVPTVDVLADLGSKKTDAQVLVGFALETNDELSNAHDKLNRKNLDFIVLNSLRDTGAGFGHDTNKVTVISKAGVNIESALMSKTDVAHEIWKIILDQTHA
jgi:phosphopantothenoylcysteine decarboxylase/phosphopantothenate--cysteine ligase